MPTVKKSVSAVSRRQVIDLAARQQLVLDRSKDESVLRITGRDGRVNVSIHVTAAGAVLKLDGADLTIQARGDLSVQADRLAFHGVNGLALSSGGDAAIHVGRDLEISARSQSLRAELGDISIKANDDIRLDGERIRNNC